MERLDFVLPKFTRISWVSDRARDVWEPRLHRLKQAWFEIEWLSVLYGMRSCCITIISSEDFISRGKEWVKQGLYVLPLQVQEKRLDTYSNTKIEADSDKSFRFRVVVGLPQALSDFQYAFEAEDNREIGKLLGFPPCCTEFYQKVRVEEKFIDTIWSMALATTKTRAEEQSLEVAGFPEANILWQWMGIRAVSHLPCSFECQQTMEFGQKLIKIGKETRYAAEMEWLQEVLSWPVEWSSLHGIAEIKTPIIKVCTQTDATATKHIVRRRGEKYPLEGSRGLNFPYHF